MTDKGASGTLHRFLPLTIRITTLGGIATPLVLRGTPLPAKRSDVFSTAADNQSEILVELLIGERPLKRDNILIGTFTLKGIPPASRGIPQLTVEFAVDTACAITASAVLQGSDIAAQQRFEPPLDLSPESVAGILAEADTAREADGSALRHAEATNRAHSLIRRAEEELKAKPDKRINEAVAALGLAMAEGSADVIREKSDSLESLISKATNVHAFDDIFRDFFGAATRSTGHKPATAPQLIQKRTVPQPSQKRTAPQPTQKQAAPPKEDVVASAHLLVLGKIFGGAAFTLDPQLCFVIMPFSDRLQPVYEDSIRQIVKAAGLRCERADDVHGSTLITWDIWERINRARFLIADLTDLNANVFYELGLAHALSKDVVLITQSMEFASVRPEGSSLHLLRSNPPWHAEAGRKAGSYDRNPHEGMTSLAS